MEILHRKDFGITEALFEEIKPEKCICVKHAVLSAFDSGEMDDLMSLATFMMPLSLSESSRCMSDRDIINSVMEKIRKSYREMPFYPVSCEVASCLYKNREVAGRSPFYNGFQTARFISCFGEFANEHIRHVYKDVDSIRITGSVVNGFIQESCEEMDRDDIEWVIKAHINS